MLMKRTLERDQLETFETYEIIKMNAKDLLMPRFFNVSSVLALKLFAHNFSY